MAAKFYRMTEIDCAKGTVQCLASNVSALDLGKTSDMVGRDVTFQDPEGRLVGKILKTDFDPSRNMGVVKLAITDPSALNFLASGVLHGVRIYDNGNASITDHGNDNFPFQVTKADGTRLEKRMQPVYSQAYVAQEKRTERAVYSALDSLNTALAQKRAGEPIRLTGRHVNRNAALIKTADALPYLEALARRRR
jgi:hypothetical protein